MGSSAVGPNG
jgi:hypothetical protein